MACGSSALFAILALMILFLVAASYKKRKAASGARVAEAAAAVKEKVAVLSVVFNEGPSGGAARAAAREAVAAAEELTAARAEAFETIATLADELRDSVAIGDAAAASRTARLAGETAQGMASASQDLLDVMASLAAMRRAAPIDTSIERVDDISAVVDVQVALVGDDPMRGALVSHAREIEARIDGMTSLPVPPGSDRGSQMTEIIPNLRAMNLAVDEIGRYDYHREKEHEARLGALIGATYSGIDYLHEDSSFPRYSDALNQLTPLRRRVSTGPDDTQSTDLSGFANIIANLDEVSADPVDISLADILSDLNPTTAERAQEWSPELQEARRSQRAGRGERQNPRFTPT
jgi:hypothetical protein